jgi:hypothetical protein
MRFKWRLWTRVLLNTGSALCIFGAAAAAAEDAAAIEWNRARVRSEDAVLTAIVHRAVESSKTFRALITKIDSTNGIVYIHEAKCPRSMAACLFQRIELLGTNRVLRIAVTPSRRGETEIAASIGHEMQHAWEVLQRPDVDSDEEMLSVWAAGLRLATEPYETDEAIQAGLRVRRELASTGFGHTH